MVHEISRTNITSPMLTKIVFADLYKIVNHLYLIYGNLFRQATFKFPNTLKSKFEKEKEIGMDAKKIFNIFRNVTNKS